jgi:hypothetical protein
MSGSSSSPQCLHFIASGLIGSAQNGQRRAATSAIW